MKMGAAEFKARCLAVLDQVHERGEPVTITKRGHVVAVLMPAGDTNDRPWMRLAGTARWQGDPLAPSVDESEIEALK